MQVPQNPNRSQTPTWRQIVDGSVPQAPVIISEKKTSGTWSRDQNLLESPSLLFQRSANHPQLSFGEHCDRFLSLFNQKKFLGYDAYNYPLQQLLFLVCKRCWDEISQSKSNLDRLPGPLKVDLELCEQDINACLEDFKKNCPEGIAHKLGSFIFSYLETRSAHTTLIYENLYKQSIGLWTLYYGFSGYHNGSISGDIASQVSISYNEINESFQRMQHGSCSQKAMEEFLILTQQRIITLRTLILSAGMSKADELFCNK